MKRLLSIVALVLAGFQAEAEGTIDVPSGQVVLPFEILWEDHVNEGIDGETWLILRFLTPDISKSTGKIRFGDAEPDIEFLCKTIGLPLADLTGGGVDQIVVNLMDLPILRGQRDPSITQFMSAYRVKSGACIWE